MRKSTKRNLKIGAATAALMLTVCGSLAYFTDNASTNASGTAGTVGIELDSTGIVLTDADGLNILNPGDMRTVSYELTNTGNKSIDVRTTIVLTSTQAMDKESAQAEYEIYLASDVELVPGEGYKPVEGAQPLAVRSISEDGKTITYKPADYILNGSADHAEREVEADVLVSDADGDIVVGANGDTVQLNYVLVFKGAASNDFQNSGVTIDVLCEAKQHRNTEAGWSLVAEEGFTVPAAN